MDYWLLLAISSNSLPCSRSNLTNALYNAEDVISFLAFFHILPPLHSISL